MIGHDFEGVNRHVQFGRFLGEKLPQAALDFGGQDRPTVLGAPHDVVLE